MSMNDPQPSTSQKDVDVFLSPRKNRPRKAFTVTEKVMIRNAYKYVKNEISAQLEAFEVVQENECVSKVADILGMTSRSVCNVLKEVKKGTPPTPPKKFGPKRSFKDKIDEFTFCAIRRIVHQFFYRNEPPTIAKILQVMNDDSEMPKISKESLRKILKHLNFKFVARSRKSTIIDRNDMITWLQRYLRSICQFRREERHIYYQDETWVNAGHTVKKPYVDKKVTSSRQAFLEGLTTGLKNPSGKGKRLIIGHIGSEESFLEEGLMIFEAKKNCEDYHDEMNAVCFEKWFAGVLPKLRPNSIV
ncbi:hypothetical protein HF086_008134, partial [Spodoptera exigua]